MKCPKFSKVMCVALGLFYSGCGSSILDVGTVDLTTPPGAGMSCDNGNLDAGETCDPPASCPTSCDDNDVCTTDVLAGAPATCNVVCSHQPITACSNGDGCCPAGCSPDTDTDCAGAGSSNAYPGPNPHAIPGVIQAEDYDQGGEGTGYHDTTQGNTYGTTYRTDDVDIRNENGAMVVGYFMAGEWLAYTVSVASSGLYDLQARVATSQASQTFRVGIDGANTIGSVSVPNTDSYHTFTVVTVRGLELSAGQHVLRLSTDTGLFDIDHLNLAFAACSNGDGECPSGCSTADDSDCVHSADLEVHFTTQSAQVSEGAGVLNLAVNLQGTSSASVKVSWSARGTATYDGAQASERGSGADFGPEQGEITFQPGETTKAITLSIIDGTAAEPDQKLTVTLDKVSAGEIQTGAATVLVTIEDNDRDVMLDVTNLPAACPLPGGSGWGGASWNLWKDGTHALDNRNRLQALLDHFSAHHVGASLVIFFPAGNYLFDVNAERGRVSIYVPLSTNQVTFVGPSSDGRNENEPQAVLRMAVPYAQYSRLIQGYYSRTTNSEMNRFLVKNLIFDGDVMNSGWVPGAMGGPSGREQCPLLFISGPDMRGLTPEQMKSAGILRWTFERSKTMRAGSGGLQGWRGVETFLWRYDAVNNFKCFAVMSGGHATLHAYEIRNWGDMYGGGIWMEGEGGPLNLYGSDWTILDGFRWYICTQAGGIVELNNVFFAENKGLYPDGNSGVSMAYSIWGSNEDYPKSGITISNSTFFGTTTHRTIGNGPITFNKCEFYSYAHEMAEDDDLSSAPRNNVAYEPADTQLTFNDCTFGNDGTRHAGFTVAGLGYSGFTSSGGWDAVPAAFMRFNNCVFDASLDGAWIPFYGSNGCTSTEFNSCTFKVSNHDSKYCFQTNRWSDAIPGLLKVKNPKYELGGNKIYYLQGTSGGANDTKCWLYHDGDLTKAQARDSIGTQYGVSTISIANASTSARISAIQRASQTTVTTAEAHGLQTGDKILFDGFSSSGNASWFSSLSPHAQVPLFTAEVIDSTRLRVKNSAGSIYLDSSGFAANYNGSADLARVSKYPFRTILGNAGDNPMADRPACLVGDRYTAGAAFFRCATSGILGQAVWVAE